MAFYVGQKVELVRGYTGRERDIAIGYGFKLPVTGKVYSVRWIEGEYIRLTELINPDIPYVSGDAEPMWLAARFRPVVERKTSIAIFEAMLNPSREQVQA